MASPILISYEFRYLNYRYFQFQEFNTPKRNLPSKNSGQQTSLLFSLGYNNCTHDQKKF